MWRRLLLSVISSNADLPTVQLVYQMSRVPLNHGNISLFARMQKKLHLICARNMRCSLCPSIKQLTKLAGLQLFMSCFIIISAIVYLLPRNEVVIVFCLGLGLSVVISPVFFEFHTALRLFPCLPLERSLVCSLM